MSSRRFRRSAAVLPALFLSRPSNVVAAGALISPTSRSHAPGGATATVRVNRARGTRVEGDGRAAKFAAAGRPLFATAEEGVGDYADSSAVNDSDSGKWSSWRRRRSSAALPRSVSGLACTERLLILDGVEPFVTVDVVDDDGNDCGCGDVRFRNDGAPHSRYSSFSSPSMTRLADVLVHRREELASGKRIVVVGSEPGWAWVALLASRLGAAGVVAFDEDRNRPRLRALEYADRVSNAMEDDDDGRLDVYCRIETAAGDGEEDRLTEGGHVDLVVLLDAAAPAKNIFVQDFLRRTSAVILIDEERADAFGYHSRIQEGADIQFW